MAVGLAGALPGESGSGGLFGGEGFERILVGLKGNSPGRHLGTFQYWTNPMKGQGEVLRAFIDESGEARVQPRPCLWG